MKNTLINKKRAIIVLGMHRSGTSALMRTINLCGVDLGRNIMPPLANNNEKGFWEHLDISHINDKLLKDINLSWDDVRSPLRKKLDLNIKDRYRKDILSILERDFSNSHFWGVKDPRLCRLLPLWHEILEQFKSAPHYIIIVRNPLEVAESLAKRDGFSKEKSCLLWLKHLVESEKETRSSSRIFVTYKELLNDWERLLSRVQNKFRFNWPVTLAEAAPEICSFLDNEMRHNRVSEEDLIKDKNISNWVRDAYYTVLDHISRSSNPFVKAMDSIEAKLKNAALLYESEIVNILNIYQIQAAEFDKMKQQLVDTKKNVLEISQNHVNFLHNIDQLLFCGSEKPAQCKDYDTMMLELEKQFSKFNNSFKASKKKINELRFIIGEKDSLIQQFTEEAKELENDISRKNNLLGELKAQLSEKHEDNLRLIEEITELRQSTSWKITAPMRLCIITARRSALQASKVIISILRKTFKKLPASLSRKRQIQNWVSTKMPSFIRPSLGHNQQFQELIASKPVANKWRPAKKLKHKYDISVIIPTYNRAHILNRLIDSWRNVVEFTKYSHEIIFSDDGSMDESIDILKEAKDLPLKIITNSHSGPAKARNAAIKIAEGEKLLFFGDDIFPNKHILNQHYEKLHELEVCDAVLGRCIWHSDLKVNHLMEHITEVGCEQFSFKNLQMYNFTSFIHFYTCNISIDREFLLSEQIIFNELFNKANWEDIELGYRLAKKGMRIFYYPEAIGQHFHLYSEVDRFCARQEIAGENALIFKRIHNEIEPVVDVDFITSKWSKYFHDKLEVADKYDIYQELIAFCQFIEDNFKTRKSILSDNLSVIYSKLFRFAYEKGIIQQKYLIKKALLNKIFKYEFFTIKFSNALCDLNRHCKAPNFSKIFYLKNSSTFKKTILTIEAEDLEHLNEIVDHYDELPNYVQYRLKSELEFNGFLYKPQKGFYLSENSLKQILFFLQKYPKIDKVLLSFGLYDLPNIGLVNSMRNSLILRANRARNHLTDLQNTFKGKIIRIFDIPGNVKTDLFSAVNKSLRYIDDYGFFSHKKFDPKSIEFGTFQFKLAYSNKKPLIFVFPTFLAVGGVERNTIEIIRHLKPKYNFVVINFERLNQQLGSLHRQLLSLCEGIYDLTELTTHENIPSFLKILKQIYKPSILWICNGSPWLANNTAAIRKLFYDTAIVDQQVYDAKEGWINIYNDRWVQSFDRFIAINSKIKKVFIEEKKIEETKIDLIYHVVRSISDDCIISNKKNDKFIKKYRINPDKRNFVFVGRLSSQKRPLLFLKMVKKFLLINQNSNFIMVGDGPLSGEIDKFIIRNDLKLVHRIKFIENIFEMYSVVDALIITSKYEGLPIAMLEAMSMGLPVFATNVGDIDIVIDQYKSGMIVPVNSSAEELVDKLLIFDSNFKIYSENAKNNANSIAKRFSGETISAIYDNCFQKAVKYKNDQRCNAKL